MPNLKCDACSCTHNKDYYCCLNGIAVGGKSATKESSTCCISFVENNGAITNYSLEPVTSMDIGCEAINCVHNHSCTCRADEVSISGDHSRNYQETQCSTFSCK